MTKLDRYGRKYGSKSYGADETDPWPMSKRRADELYRRVSRSKPRPYKLAPRASDLDIDRALRRTPNSRAFMTRRPVVKEPKKKKRDTRSLVTKLSDLLNPFH